MANHTIIADVCMEIVSRLKEAIDQPVFCGHPEKVAEYPLGLFLYDIELMERSFYNGNRIAVCLKYMIFANSQASIELKAIEEQKLIAKAMQALGDNWVIYANNNFLGENDLGISIVQENISLDDKIKLLSNMGGVKPVLFYRASPVFVDTDSTDAAARVVSTGG